MFTDSSPYKVSTPRAWKPPRFDWEKRSSLSIAQGALTNSKRPEAFVKGIYPTHLESQRGAYSFDTDGNRYIDFICGLGTSLLGYSNEEILRAIRSSLDEGITFSLGTPKEILLAEKLQEIFPFTQKTKFLKSGSEACSAAIRIARAHTGRNWVLSDGYHGWHEDFIHVVNPKVGPTAETLKYEKLDQISEYTAAVIIEPVIVDASEKRAGELREIKKRCQETGTLLIFDEVITGFRFPQFSVSNYFGIEPDLICLGKALGGGMPLAAVAGKSKIMDGDYFVSSTFAGETLSISAALQFISILQTKSQFNLNYLWDRGTEFLFKFNEIWRDGIWIEGYPTRGIFRGDELTRALFFQEACKAGILFGPSWFFNFSHVALMDQVLSVCKDILMKIQTGSVQLEGSLPVTPFAQKIRS